jgi:FkbM family methyltransferase
MVRVSKANSSSTSRGRRIKVLLIASASVVLICISTVHHFSSLDPHDVPASYLALLQGALEPPTASLAATGVGVEVPTESQFGGLKTTSKLATTGGGEILDNLVREGINAEHVWKQLLEEGAAAMLHNTTENSGIVIEVGVHKALQCLQAAQFGWKTHCVEPSPKSFSRVKSRVNQKGFEAARKQITLHNVAAGSSSGGTVPFTAVGGTGDHVGDINMWTMEKTAADTKTKTESGELIEVPSMRLDDLIRQEMGDKPVFLMKVDTQGFEAAVFEGLTESIRGPNPKIQYILTEYWPKGMDFQSDKPRACVAADLLEKLSAQGYTLYALGVSAHPKAPKFWQQSAKDRPLNNIRANCQWYYDLEDRLEPVNTDNYRMGYWSDIVAVAPNAPPLPGLTKVARALKRSNPM